jgi:hypothetical protein
VRVAEVDGVTVAITEGDASSLSDELIDPPIFVAEAKVLVVASDDCDAPMNTDPETVTVDEKLGDSESEIDAEIVDKVDIDA